MSTLIFFVLSAINVTFIVADPTLWLNWAAAAFCFVLGIASALES